MHRPASLITALAAAVAAVVVGVPLGTGVAHAASVHPGSAPIAGGPAAQPPAPTPTPTPTPAPAPSPTGELAADLAATWLGWDYHGVSGNYWLAPHVPEYWCSDFATYVWQQAGIDVPTLPLVKNFVSWAKQHVRFTTDLSQLQAGDVIFYPHHVGVVIQVSADGTVQTADGDFGGDTGWNKKHAPVPESYFSEHSTVELDTFNPQDGDGPAGTIVGIGLAG